MSGVDSAQPFGFTFGKSKTDTDWSDFQRFSWPQLVQKLTSHIPGPKNGPCIVPAKFSGSERKKEFATQIDVAFLDSDAGATLEEIENAIRAKGWEAVISSTHSHMSTETEVSLTNWDKFFAKNKNATAEQFLIEDKKYLPRIAKDAACIRTDDKLVYIWHQPCPKFRVVIPLQKPWLASNYPSQTVANAAWKECVEALASALSLNHDQACTDTSRLFYLPRRPPGGVVPETSVIAGTHCDIFSLPRPQIAAQGKLSDAPTPKQRKTYFAFVDPDTGEVFDLSKWAKEIGPKFLIADAILARRPSVLTGYNVDGRVHIDCPNASAHTSQERDSATYVSNATKTTNKGFVFHCRHGHCTDKDRLFFIQRVLEEKWLSTDDLISEQFQAKDASGQKKQESPKHTAIKKTRNLPGILIRIAAGDLHRMTTEAEDAILASDVPIYQRGTILVRPVVQRVPASKGRFTLSASLHQIGVPALIDELSACASWEKFDARCDDWIPANPPKMVAEIMLSRAGLWTLPSVVGIVTCPTLRPDGSIISAPGYDLITRLYHAVDTSLILSPAVEAPTMKDALAAKADLSELLREFPAVGEVSFSVMLSSLITPVVRGAMAVAPLHAFRASTAGTGKSYLVDTASAISTGRACPVATAAADEGETEKRIAGLLLGGFPIASIDNVNGDLGGDLLCQAIERPTIRIRALGSSDILEIESRTTFFATGNALRVKGDMVRRALICDLDAGEERPETRVFNGDPMGSVMADRGRYVSACLIIVRAYILAGKPGKLNPLASFGEWSDLVRSALVWIGCADPAKSMEAAREDDPELTELKEFIATWTEHFPNSFSFTVKQMVEKSEEKTEPVRDENGKVITPGELLYASFRDALLGLAGDRGVVNTKRLASWLRKKEGRIVLGHRLKKGAAVHGGVYPWSVDKVPVGSVASAG